MQVQEQQRLSRWRRSWQAPCLFPLPRAVRKSRRRARFTPPPPEIHCMMRTAKKGFTLIELLIVVVIIGILAAIAIPKFANTKDKAKLASVKSDVRNLMGVMEAVSTKNDNKYRAPLADEFTVSTGNLAAFDAADAGYTITVNNASITEATKSCHVEVGSKA